MFFCRLLDSRIGEFWIAKFFRKAITNQQSPSNQAIEQATSNQQ
jgi:hypothetical protein